MKTTRTQSLLAAALGIEDYENEWGTDLFSHGWHAGGW